MFDSKNVIQTTIPSTTLLSSLVDPTLLDDVVRAYTADASLGVLPTDAPVDAVTTLGFTVLQFGMTQLFQQQGAMWMRSAVAPTQPWHKLLPPVNPNAVSGFPYGITDLPLEYLPLLIDSGLAGCTAPGIYIGDAALNNSFIATCPTGASGQGFALEVNTFPMVIGGVTRQCYSQTYTDTVGEWKRVYTNTGAFSAWKQVVTF